MSIGLQVLVSSLILIKAFYHLLPSSQHKIPNVAQKYKNTPWTVFINSVKNQPNVMIFGTLMSNNIFHQMMMKFTILP